MLYKTCERFGLSPEVAFLDLEYTTKSPLLASPRGGEAPEPKKEVKQDAKKDGKKDGNKGGAKKGAKKSAKASPRKAVGQESGVKLIYKHPLGKDASGACGLIYVAQPIEL